MQRPAALLAAVLALAPAGLAGTWYVDVNGSPPGTGTLANPYTSLAFALAQPTTVSGDFVRVAPGTYTENVVFPGRGVTVASVAGPSVTIIDAAGSGSAVAFLGTDGTAMVLQGFTVTGGKGTTPLFDPLGGGIYAVDAIYEVHGCIVTGNDAFEGGGLFAQNGVGWIQASQFTANTVTGQGCRGAGMALDGGSATLQTVLIDHNVAGDFSQVGRGGGIATRNGGTIDALGCEVSDNQAELGGGGISGSGVLDTCRILRNGGQFGGGVEVPFSAGAMQIVDSVIEGNWANSASGTANFGGGIWGKATVTNTTIRDNVCFGSGAGVDGGFGGAILVECDLVLNRAYAGWGLDDVAGGADNAVLIDCFLDGNEAHGSFIAAARGGGAADSFLADCVVRDNLLTSASLAEGAGLYECDAVRVRIHGNSLLGRGGGAWGGTLFRCELFDNSALRGGGAADASLDRCTVFGNQGAPTGGVYADFSATVHDSILWDNGREIGKDPAALVTVTYSDIKGGYPGTGNLNTNPDFWNAPAGDFRLKPGSHCIDAGDPASKPDPDGTRADMGARYFDPAYLGIPGKLTYP